MSHEAESRPSAALLPMPAFDTETKLEEISFTLSGRFVFGRLAPQKCPTGSLVFVMSSSVR